MKKFYLLTIFVVCVGVILSLIIFPTLGEVAYTQSMSKNYDDALNNYGIYFKDNGNPPEYAVLDFAELCFNIGDTQKAVSILKSYIKKNAANSVRAQLELQKFYLNSLEPELYEALLEKYSNGGKNVANAQKLINYYFYHGNDLLMVKEIFKLYDNHPSNLTLNDYRMLVYYLAHQGNYSEASKIIDDAVANYEIGTQITINDTYLFTSIFLKNDQYQKALQIAKKYVSYSSNPSDVMDIANLIAVVNQNDAVSLIIPLFEKYPNNQQVLVLLFSLAGTDSKYYKKSYEILLAEYETDKLPKNLFNIFLQQLVFFGNYPTLHTIIKESSPFDYSVKSINMLAENFYLSNQNELAKMLMNKFPPIILNENIAIKILLSATASNESTDAVIKRIKENISEIPELNLLFFVSVFYSQKNYDFAYQLLSRTNFYDAVLYLGPTLFTNTVYSSNNALNEIAVVKKELMNDSLTNDEIQQNYQMLFLLYSMIYNTQEAEKYSKLISSNNKLYKSSLESLYYLAIDNNKYKLALRSSETLFQLANTEANRLYLANSLILTDDVERGLDYYLTFKDRNSNFTDVYLAGFTSLYTSDNYVINGVDKSDCRDFLEFLLNNWTNLSIQQKNSAAYLASISNNGEFLPEFFIKTINNEPISYMVASTIINFIGQTKDNQLTAKILDKYRESSNLEEKANLLIYLNELGKYSLVFNILNNGNMPDVKQNNITYYEPLFIRQIFVEYKKMVKDYFAAPYMQSLLLLQNYDLFVKCNEFESKIMYQNIPIEQKPIMAETLYNAGFYSQSYNVLEQVPLKTILSTLSPETIAYISIKSNHVEDSIKIFVETQQEDSDYTTRNEILLGLLYLASNNGKKLDEMILKDKIPYSSYYPLGVVASLTSHTKLLVTISQKIFNLNNNSLNRQFYISSLLANEDYLSVLDFIPSPTDSRFDTNAYLSALDGQKLSNSSFSIDKYEKQITLIYNKLMSYKLNDENLSDIMNAGYVFADIGENRLARNLFLKISDYSAPGSKNVDELVYLWEKTGKWEKGNRWLYLKASKSKGMTQLRWLELMNKTGNSEEVLKLLKDNR